MSRGTRCPFAQDVFAAEEPLARSFGPGHQAACHFPLQTPVKDQAAAIASPDACWGLEVKHASVRDKDFGHPERVRVSRAAATVASAEVSLQDRYRVPAADQSAGDDLGVDADRRVVVPGGGAQDA